MTNADIMTTILAEVTGRPEREIAPLLDVARSHAPGHRLDVELSPADAQALLAALRAEKAGILNWLIEGRRRVEQRM